MTHATDLSPLAVDAPDLSYLRIDHQARLQFGDTQVVIESAFLLEARGVVHELDPGVRISLGPFLSLYPNVLSTLGVQRDGTLSLHFESGATVTVPPDPNFEAWQVDGPGTRLVVCPPGGSPLAVWS
jgi:hypothetical protein